MSHEHGATYAGAIVKSVSIENMLNQRAAVVDRIGQAITLLREARDLAAAAHVGFPRITLDENRYSYRSTILDEDRNNPIERDLGKIIDAGAWQYLMNESGLRTLMDAKARAQWDDGIQKGDFPEFTLPNVEGTFAGLYGARGEMFERGVIECFKRLSWDYKTNTPFKFGKRLVLRYITSSSTGGIGYANSRNCDELDDLIRVLCVLDAKAEPDHRRGTYHTIDKARTASPPIGENDYFSIRLHKNGNGHLTFKRPDLVEKMNKILAKHFPGALPYDRHAT